MTLSARDSLEKDIERVGAGVGGGWKTQAASVERKKTPGF